MIQRKFLAIYMLLFFVSTHAQKADTLIITPAHINTSKLKPGIHQWILYSQVNKTAPRKILRFINYEVAHTNYEGTNAITVRETMEDGDTIFLKSYAVCDAKSFKPLYFESWLKPTKKEIKFDFIKKTAIINGKNISRTDTAIFSRKLTAAIDSVVSNFTLNWHIDLVTFPVFPYKAGRSFVIDFYDPGSTGIAKKNIYTVIGSNQLNGYNGKMIDCWILERKNSTGSRQLFWISKKSKETLKLEEEYMGRFVYKVKLGFSND